MPVAHTGQVVHLTTLDRDIYVSFCVSKGTTACESLSVVGNFDPAGTDTSWRTECLVQTPECQHQTSDVFSPFETAFLLDNEASSLVLRQGDDQKTRSV